jgi:catechol 2,3-dioxygenase-like lactoylglutathione lyase family enzyme
MEATKISRRSLLVSLSAMAAAPALAKIPRWLPSPQAPPKAPLAMRELNHFTLMGPEPQRTRDFYQAVFGMPVQAVQGTGPGGLLKVGMGNEYVAVAGGANQKTAVIDHWSINLEKFDVDTVMKAFAERGVMRVEQPGTMPMIAWVRSRGPQQGGAPEGTSELYFNDPDGIKGQVQDPSYCGGAGVLGNACPALPQVAGLDKAPIKLRGLSHFTLSCSDPQRSLAFYQGIFGMPIQTHQGNTPLLRIGPGPQFVALGGVGNGGKPGINHVCFTMDNFDPDRVMKILADHGVKKVEQAGKEPLTAWSRLRMPAQGGGPEGTLEFYFNDPNGITVQLQDTRYCGGAGKLGEICRG